MERFGFSSIENRLKMSGVFDHKYSRNWRALSLRQYFIYNSGVQLDICCTTFYLVVWVACHQYAFHTFTFFANHLKMSEKMRWITLPTTISSKLFDKIWIWYSCAWRVPMSCNHQSKNYFSCSNTLLDWPDANWTGSNYKSTKLTWRQLEKHLITFIATRIISMKILTRDFGYLNMMTLTCLT